MSQNEIERLRLEIDEIDEQIIALFCERQKVAEKIGIIKKEFSLPIVDQERKKQILKARRKKACEIGLSESDLGDLFDFLHKKAVEIQS